MVPLDKPTRFTLRINGKTWVVHRVMRPRTATWRSQPHQLDGDASYSDRRIYLNPDLVGAALLETAAHEFLHARFQDLDEDVVDAAAKELTRLLSRLGFREDWAESVEARS